MVSLKKKFSIYFFISALVLLCLLIPAELKASIPCCKNGKLSSCPDLPNGQQYDISGCQSVSPINPDGPVIDFPIDGGEIIGPIDPIVKCTSGQSQYKPNGDCGTSERTCCSDGTWSGWDGECSDSSSCGSNECWDGSKCAAKPSSTACTCTNGTCSLTYSCISGSGWKSTKNCTCSSGYQKNSSGECVHSSCTKNCGTGKYLREISSGYNKGQCECCTPQGRQILADGSCGSILTVSDCLDTLSDTYTRNCCHKRDEYGIVTGYYLPSSYSSCSSWGSALGWTMESIQCCSSMGL